MADGSWDNSGHGVPAKAGMPTWTKVLLGCGIAFLIALVTCVGGIAYMANRVKKDPEGFKKQVMGFAIDKLRPDWDDFCAVLEQLRTPEGSRALYAANPGLAKTWPTEKAFLVVAADWRKDLAPTPDLTPDMLEKEGLQINHQFAGQVRVGWRPKAGRSVFVTFEGSRKQGDKGPRHVLELDVR